MNLTNQIVDRHRRLSAVFPDFLPSGDVSLGDFCLLEAILAAPSEQKKLDVLGCCQTHSRWCFRFDSWTEKLLNAESECEFDDVVEDILHLFRILEFRIYEESDSEKITDWINRFCEWFKRVSWDDEVSDIVSARLVLGFANWSRRNYPVAECKLLTPVNEISRATNERDSADDIYYDIVDSLFTWEQRKQIEHGLFNN